VALWASDAGGSGRDRGPGDRKRDPSAGIGHPPRVPAERSCMLPDSSTGTGHPLASSHQRATRQREFPRLCTSDAAGPRRTRDLGPDIRRPGSRVIRNGGSSSAPALHLRASPEPPAASDSAPLCPRGAYSGLVSGMEARAVKGAGGADVMVQGGDILLEVPDRNRLQAADGDPAESREPDQAGPPASGRCRRLARRARRRLEIFELVGTIASATADESPDMYSAFTFARGAAVSDATPSHSRPLCRPSRVTRGTTRRSPRVTCTRSRCSRRPSVGVERAFAGICDRAGGRPGLVVHAHRAWPGRARGGSICQARQPAPQLTGDPCRGQGEQTNICLLRWPHRNGKFRRTGRMGPTALDTPPMKGKSYVERTRSNVTICGQALHRWTVSLGR
jgi:hypothetical protein